jgi:UDP-N-acetylglucosamine acyltransferase
MENMQNNIHPSVIIEGDVKLGKNNTILPFTILIGPLTIGDNNIIGPSVVIGSPGQDTRNPRYDSTNSRIEIGNNNIIREFTAVQKPCYQDLTKIGNDVFLMQSVHIPHDAIIGDKVVITPMVVLAGISRILFGANLGMGSTVNQYCVIGQYSIVATGAAAMKNVKPFSRYIPGQKISVNEYAINKYGFQNYLTEITNYVLDNIEPVSERINRIIKDYEEHHKASRRDQY